MPQKKSTSFPYQCWFILYLLTLLCFAPFLINFFWGNHDWSWVKEYTSFLSGVFEGRFSQFILPTLLFSGNILPILTTTISLLCFTLAAVLLLKMWNVQNKKTHILLLSLYLVTSPYILSWFYFAFLTLSCLSWTLAIISAFYLLNNVKKHHLLCYISATTLFTLALGGYPPVINMIGVLFFTLIINDLYLKKSTLKTIIKKYIPQMLTIIIATLCFILSQYLLKKFNFQQETYNTASISLNSILDNLILCSKTAITQFFKTISFIEGFYKYGSLFLLILAIIELFIETPKKITNQLCLILAIIGLLFSSTLTLLLAQNTIYVTNEPRIEFFGLVYIYVFSASILLTHSSPFIRNATYVTLTCLICYNFTITAYCAKIWRLGYQAETSQMERFISRLETNPQFNPNTKYTFIQSGTINMRKRFYITDSTIKHDSYTLDAPYVPWHLPYKAYTFYYPTVFIENDFDIYWQFVNPYSIPMTDSLEEYLTLSARPWPKPESLYISPNLIIVTLSSEGKGRGQYWFATHYQNPSHK